MPPLPPPPRVDFERFAELVPILIWTANADGHCDYLSPHWYEYTGRAAHDLIGDGWLDAVHPDDRRDVEPAWRSTVAAGCAFHVECRLRRHDGAYRWFVARGVPDVGATSAISRWYVSYHDIQPQKEAEFRLHRQQTTLEQPLVIARQERDDALERMQLATRFAGIGIWDWNVDEDTLMWNEQMYRLFDVPSAHEPSYAGWLSTIVPEDREIAQRSVEQALSGESDFLVTYRVALRDGRERVIRAVAKLGPDTRGHRRMVGICLDVTVEHRNERLQESRLTTLREFIRHAPAAIAMLDTELRYIEASERWSEMYSLTTALTGRRHYDVFPEIPERWKQIHREVLAGAVHSNPEDPFVRADGQVQYVAWEARPWYNESGSVGGALFFNQDVTGAVQLRHRLEEQSRQLRRSNEDLQQFAYAASHDLQEPLRAVSGFAQILGHRYAGRLDGDADMIIGHMTEGAKRMRNLIDDLLTFSRVGEGDTRRTTTPLRDIVDTALQNLTSAVAERGAVIEVETLPTVAIDRPLMVQLFQNLIGNSIKYAGAAAPYVHISYRTHRDRYEIIVRDRGIGVPADAATRVFQIFQRLHTRDEYDGTGIGLALCRRIVERHDGSIWLSQPDGPGCAIHFTLPVDLPAHGHA